MAALGALRAPRGAATFWPKTLVVGGAIVVGGAVGAAMALPQYQLVFAGIALTPILLAVLGPEMCACLLLLAGFGGMPLVNAEATAGGIPVWLIAEGGAVALMFATFVSRSIARAPAWRIQPSLLLLIMGVLFAYTIQRLVASSPLEFPSLTANAAAFAVLTPVAFLWLTHVGAVDGVKKALPVVAGLLAVWCVIWVAGSTGACS